MSNGKHTQTFNNFHDAAGRGSGANNSPTITPYMIGFVGKNRLIAVSSIIAVRTTKSLAADNVTYETHAPRLKVVGYFGPDGRRGRKMEGGNSSDGFGTAWETLAFSPQALLNQRSGDTLVAYLLVTGPGGTWLIPRSLQAGNGPIMPVISKLRDGQEHDDLTSPRDNMLMVRDVDSSHSAHNSLRDIRGAHGEAIYLDEMPAFTHYHWTREMLALAAEPLAEDAQELFEYLKQYYGLICQRGRVILASKAVTDAHKVVITPAMTHEQGLAKVAGNATARILSVLVKTEARCGGFLPGITAESFTITIPEEDCERIERDDAGPVPASRLKHVAVIRDRIVELERDAVRRQQEEHAELLRLRDESAATEMRLKEEAEEAARVAAEQAAARQAEMAARAETLEDEVTDMCTLLLQGRILMTPENQVKFDELVFAAGYNPKEFGGIDMETEETPETADAIMDTPPTLEAAEDILAAGGVALAAIEPAQLTAMVAPEPQVAAEEVKAETVEQPAMAVVSDK